MRSYRVQLYIGCALILLALNVYVAHRLFTVEFSGHLESNEGTFMAIAKGMADHPMDLTWWPFWAAGIPFENTYLPFLHAVVALFSVLTGCSIPLSFHVVSAAFYCLQPVTFFLLAATLSRRIGYSFIGSLLFSLISPASLIFRDVRNDIGGAWYPRRLQVLGYYGEGPHMTTLALLPLAVLLMHLALKYRRIDLYLLTGATMAGVVLSNAFGVVDLLIFSVCLLATVHFDRPLRNLLTAAALGGVTYLVISPALTPTLLRTVRIGSQMVGGDFRFTSRTAAGFLLVGAGFLVIWWITRRLNVPDYLRLFLLFAFTISAIPVLATSLQIYLFPQPHRYEVEMEMALCVAAALTAGELLGRVRSHTKGRVLKAALLACLLILAVRQTIHYVRYARRLIIGVDIKTTAPYNLAMFLKNRFRTERVFVTGTSSYLFNYFTGIPQLHGAHDPNDPNWAHKVAVFVIYSGMNAGARDAEISVLWLRAFGVQAVTVPGTPNIEYSQVFANPKKFEGVLPVLWNQELAKVYAVPNRSPAIAHVVPGNSIVAHPPVNGLDVGEISTYVAALEDPSLPLAQVTWHDLHSFSVQTDAQPAQAISIQETYADGWHAEVNGIQTPVTADGLGLMVVQTHCHGECRVEMYYDGGWDLKLAKLASGISLFGLLAWCGVAWRKRKAVLTR